MKPINSPFLAIAIAAAAVAPHAVAAVSIPQAPVITYGLVRDEFGSPLTSASAAALALVRDAAPGGTVYAKTSVGATAFPGMNYRLSLEIDSAGPSRSYAVLEGTPMRIRCTLDGADASLTPTPVFATPKNGTAQRLDFSLGEDADGDGMPDAWEAWVLRCAGQAADAAAIAAFRADGDADGDGMSNYREYLAGTDPFLATDLLAITAFARDEETGRLAVTFTTVPDRKYRLVTTVGLENPVWAPVATAREKGAAAVYETYDGTGRLITVYVDAPDEVKSFFRVAGN